jgi:hypothetical protein
VTTFWSMPVRDPGVSPLALIMTMWTALSVRAGLVAERQDGVSVGPGRRAG